MSVQKQPCIEHSLHAANVVVTVLVERIREPETVTQIKEAMTEVVSSHMCQNLIIDMNRVEFIGSIGFLAFLAVRRIPGVENIILCNMSENITELFLLCRLISQDGVTIAPFKKATSVPSALEWCAASYG